MALAGHCLMWAFAVSCVPKVTSNPFQLLATRPSSCHASVKILSSKGRTDFFPKKKEKKEKENRKDSFALM